MKSLKLNTIPTSSGSEQFKKEDDDVAGKQLKVIFHLPSGAKVEHEARVGHSVEQLKAWLASKEDIQYEKLNLYYNDKHMPDPLCLNDIPVDTSTDTNIKVEVK